MIIWEECGHHIVRHELCTAARSRDPPTACKLAHEPIATDVPASHGLCPRVDKHGNLAGDLPPDRAHMR
ncbi:hypothetical protein AMS68_003760 [Peltaster fructicola]|uniref:Uncharacterized protein n=1 Tax=Peltaster fructicola TaxID=286661 RepID=A0A6H0XU41_9PEZI|nr:hypothetical protein AMS68_003760 [Peltaster fructicola]